MTLTVTHPKVSLIADDPVASAAGEVLPSDWNATHTISGTIETTIGGTGQSTYTKGDLLASPGSNTLDKLPVGADTFVLTADAASTNGIKWAAAPSGGGVTVDTTTITGGTTARLLYDNAATVGETDIEYTADGRLLFTNAYGNIFLKAATGGSASATGIGNVGLGDDALSSLTTGFQNVALGYQAGILLSTGDRNFALGTSSLFTCSTGNENVAIGFLALHDTNGDKNVAIGSQALADSTGTDNVAIGGSAGMAFVVDGSNVLIGSQAGAAMTAGTGNTIIGPLAGRDITNGDVNTLIGGWAGPASSMSSVIAFSDGNANLRLDYHYTNANNWTFAKPLVVPAYTVGALPTGVTGAQAHVTDGDAGLAWGATVINSGAGATKYLVWYNGANWTVVGK